MPEIDWHHYQSANTASKAIVRHQIHTEPTFNYLFLFVEDDPWMPPPPIAEISPKQGEILPQDISIIVNNCSMSWIKYVFVMFYNSNKVKYLHNLWFQHCTLISLGHLGCELFKLISFCHKDKIPISSHSITCTDWDRCKHAGCPAKLFTRHFLAHGASRNLIFDIFL